MSLLDQWLLGPQEIPFEKSASFLVELCQPVGPRPLPPRTPQVQAGQLKLAALATRRAYRMAKEGFNVNAELAEPVEGLDEMERQALVDPDVQAALEYEQVKAENGDLQQQLEATQAQLAATSQQAQMAEQQASEAAMTQEQMQAQIEQDAQEKLDLQQQALGAQEASLAERVQTMEQREQLAQAATAMKEQLHAMAEGVGELRAQAAGPPPSAQPEPIPEPDPTAPAEVQKEQEQAQKAELEAEQQKAQVELQQQQEAMKDEVQAAQQEGMAPPEPMPIEGAAEAGPGGPIEAAPQVPTPAGGALPKTSSEKLAAGSTSVELPMSQYPKAPTKSVVDSASTPKLPPVGKVLPNLDKLTDESSKLESAVEPELAEPDPDPEMGKKEDKDLKEKQASLWAPTSAVEWLAKLGEEELEDMSTEELVQYLESLPQEELAAIFSALSDAPSGDDITVSRDQEVTIPFQGPAETREKYQVGMDSDEVARRLGEMGKQAAAPQVNRGESALFGGVWGGAVGAGTGGALRGSSEAFGNPDELRGKERVLRVLKETGKGALVGGGMGGALGTLGGLASMNAQRAAIKGAPFFDAQTGERFSKEVRENLQRRAQTEAMSGISGPLGSLSGFVGGQRGPEFLQSLRERFKGKEQQDEQMPVKAAADEDYAKWKRKKDKETLSQARHVGLSSGATLGGGAGIMAAGPVFRALQRRQKGLGAALYPATLMTGAGIGGFLGAMGGQKLMKGLAQRGIEKKPELLSRAEYGADTAGEKLYNAKVPDDFDDVSTQEEFDADNDRYEQAVKRLAMAESIAAGKMSDSPTMDQWKQERLRAQQRSGRIAGGALGSLAGYGLGTLGGIAYERLKGAPDAVAKGQLLGTAGLGILGAVKGGRALRRMEQEALAKEPEAVSQASYDAALKARQFHRGEVPWEDVAAAQAQEDALRMQHAKQGSGELSKTARTYDEYKDELKRYLGDRAAYQGKQHGQALGAVYGGLLGTLGGAGLGAAAIRNNPRSVAPLLGGAAAGGLGLGYLGAKGLGKVYGEDKRKKSDKLFEQLAPEHLQAGHDVENARSAYLAGEEGAEAKLQDAVKRFRAAEDISRSNLKKSIAKGLV